MAKSWVAFRANFVLTLSELELLFESLSLVPLPDPTDPEKLVPVIVPSPGVLVAVPPDTDVPPIAPDKLVEAGALLPDDKAVPGIFTTMGRVS